VSPLYIYSFFTARYFHLLWPRLTSLRKSFSTVSHTIRLDTSERSPAVRRVTFFPYIGIIYTCCIRSVYRTLFCLANSSYKMCLMMFVFLRPEICLRLPSDSTSRWTPLPLANGWQLIAPITDLHRQIYSPCTAHQKKRARKYIRTLFKFTD